MNRRSILLGVSSIALAGLIFFVGYQVGTQRQLEGLGSEESSQAQRSSGSRTTRSSGDQSQRGSSFSNGFSDGAFREIVRDSNSLERAAAWANLIKDANAEDLKRLHEESLAWYYEGGQRDDIFNSIFFRQGQISGQEALAKIKSIDPNGKLEIQDHLKMKGWSSADPMGAKAWLDGLDDGSVKQSLMASWYEGAVSENPQLATDLFKSLPTSMKAAGLDPLINSIHKEGGLEELVEWFDSNLENPIEGLTTQQAFDNISLRLGQSAPINSADVEATLLNPKYAPFVNAKSFSQATYHLSVNKPGHVVDLVEKLSTQNENLGNNEIRGMLKKVVGTSTRKGLFNMGDWLNQNQDHPLYDMSTRYFVEYAARTDHETAAGWAEKIGDEALRAEAEKVLQR